MQSTQSATGLSPALALRQLIFGHRLTKLILTAVELGLADHLAGGPQTSTQLARLVQADERALYRLLRALASIGILTEVGQDRFALTALGDGLRTDAPSGMRHWALFEGSDYYQQAWADLTHAIRTGETAFDHALGMDFYRYMAQYPDAGRSFNEAMIDFSALAVASVVEAYDFMGFGRIVDVGGGYGTLLGSILRAHPQTRGVLFDLPAVVAGAEPHLARAGLLDRCELIGGDMFEAVPADGDLYLLSRILMVYDDTDCVRILEKCRRAMAERGRVLIIQQVMPPPGDDTSRDALFEAAMSDLNMLVLVTGRERTEAEYGQLLAAAGLRLERVIPTRSLMSIVEGRRA